MVEGLEGVKKPRRRRRVAAGFTITRSAVIRIAVLEYLKKRPKG